jgi:PAS domain S-box-containing protein
MVIGASKIARDITPQKQAQRALLEYQQRLAVTLENIGDAVIATDSEQRIRYANGAAGELLGHSLTELNGRRLSEVFSIVNGDTRRPIENSVEQVLRYGSTVSRTDHTLLLRPDGKEIPMRDRAAPMKDAEGRVIGSVLVVRDVSQEHAAARLSALLSAIVGSSDDAIISKDLNGTIMSWNDGAERIFGYSAQEAVGQSIRLLIPPDRQDEEADILRRLSRGQRIEHYETVRRKKNGQLCDISLTISPMRDREGRIFGASKIARDITEQKRAQRALFDAQERWRVTLESIGDGVIATDTKGVVTFANSVALKLTGRLSASMIGRPLEEVFIIINEESRKPVVNPIQRVIREGVVVGLANHTLLVRPDGSEVPIHDSAAPILDDTQRLKGVVLVFRENSGR